MAAPYKILTTEQGLSSSMVCFLYQDRHGMIWIGTEDGLNRYDGIKITTYRHQKDDPNSLHNNYVRALLEDVNGNLIVSTYGGIQIYKHRTDDFTSIAIQSDGQSFNLSITGMVLHIDSLDSTSNKIYGTGDQISEIEIGSNAQTIHIKPANWDVPLNNTGELEKDYLGNLWLRRNNNLYRIDAQNGKAQTFSLPDHSEGAMDNLLNDGTGRIYLSSNATLYEVSDKGMQPLPLHSSIASSPIRSIIRIDSAQMLVGTDGEGIKLINETTGEIKPYNLDIPGLPSQLLKVHRMMRDREGNIWIGLYQKGVIMLSQRSSQFKYIGHKVSQYDQIGSSCITAICHTQDNGTWVGTDGDGLYYLSSKNNRHYTSKEVPPVINAIFEDSEGTLWTGSYGYPCYRKRKGEEKFSKVREFKTQNGRSACVFGITEDRQRQLWFATMGNGLFCYDLKTHKFVDIDNQGINIWQNCILSTSRGDLLVGTYNGIYILGPDGQKGQQLCSKQIIYSLFEDNRGQLWAGTAEGLIRFNLHGQQMDIWTTQDGLPSNSIYSIHNDNADRLWIATNAGLSCFDSQSNSFTNYAVGDGLQGDEFSKGTVAMHHDGCLWFGGNNGISFFNPDQVQQSGFELEPRLNGLYLNNNSLPIQDSAFFSLPYEDNSFSIELATKQFDIPEELIYMYSINDGEWAALPHGNNLVSFSNLSSGHYNFKYRVSYHGKSSEPQTLLIEIQHPWWNSLWAHLAYIFIVCMFISLIFIWWRTHEKVKILALISHKIRTPMSLIISPLQQLIEEESDSYKLNTYQLMLRNAMKLQHLAAQATEEEPIGPISIINDQESDSSYQKNVQTRTTNHLLIVEDDDDVRHYLTKELSRDFHIREARDGKEALELIFQRQPDAIISDVTMPVMDGITLCRKLKRNIQQSHIPVILLTARADEESKLQGLGIGADAYVTKPFSIRVLRQEVINLIQLRQQLRNTFQGQQQQEDRLGKIEVEDYNDKLMERVMNVINEHISDPDFSIEYLCEQVGISRAQLHRKLKEKTNQSTSIFIRNIRLRQAEKLLIETDIRISEIAETVGFKQDSYFINSFRELYGMSPSEWRKSKSSKS